MAQIVWDDTMSTGVSKFDEQHKQLIEMVNQLFEAMRTGTAGNKLESVVTQLEGYIATHFRDEEASFAKFNYPDAKEHIREHQKFIAEVEKFRNDLKISSVGISIMMVNFLKEWLTHHIMVVDKKYGAHMNSAGLK